MYVYILMYRCSRLDIYVVRFTTYWSSAVFLSIDAHIYNTLSEKQNGQHMRTCNNSFMCTYFERLFKVQTMI